MADDPYRALAHAAALSALDPGEAREFEAHAATCAGCAEERDAAVADLARLSASGGEVAPPPGLRQHVMEMTGAPFPPIDVAAYEWTEAVPGIRMAVLSEDPARSLRTVLVWAKPGAKYPRHRHRGDEEILVLQGALRDFRGTYGPGQICRSREGSVHTEEAMPGEDCFCFVVYHGEHEMVAE